MRAAFQAIVSALRARVRRGPVPADLETWAREHVFVSGDEYFENFFQAIQAAERSVWLETYILRDDEIGKRLLELLSQAGARGVDVRLHIDAFGSQDWIARRRDSYESAAVTIRIYNPIFSSKLWPLLRRLQISRLKSAFTKLNRRTHRKFMVVDDRIAFVGSMNMCAEPLERLHGNAAWRDTGVRLEGAPVRLIGEVFERSWKGKFYKVAPSRPTRSSLLRDNSSPVRRARNHRRLLRQLAAAQKRVLITTAYFIPERRLRQELRRAAERGVRVELIVPGRSDVFFLPWVSRHFFRRLLDSGVGVFEFQSRMIHAKTIVIDDSAWIGSSNLNSRSLYWDMELDVRVQTAPSVEVLVAQFDEDKLASIAYRTRQSRFEILSPTHWLGRLLLRLKKLF